MWIIIVIALIILFIIGALTYLIGVLAAPIIQAAAFIANLLDITLAFALTIVKWVMVAYNVATYNIFDFVKDSWAWLQGIIESIF